MIQAIKEFRFAIVYIALHEYTVSMQLSRMYYIFTFI